jgi:membrane-associated PAP2 superfamily phosphatase
MLLLFGLFPVVDLAITDLFYKGGRFPANDWILVQAAYRIVPWFGRAILAAMGLVLLVALVHPAAVAKYWRRRAAVLLMCALFGAGVFTETLKESFGRPRPSQVVEFGGRAQFHGILQPSSDCSGNCSFVSGHATTGFGLMAFGLLGSLRIRRRWWWIATISGFAFGTLRVAQGAHFASDVVFAMVVMWGTCLPVRLLWLRAALWRHRIRRRMRAARAVGARNASRESGQPPGADPAPGQGEMAVEAKRRAAGAGSKT